MDITKLKVYGKIMRREINNTLLEARILRFRYQLRHKLFDKIEKNLHGNDLEGEITAIAFGIFYYLNYR